jgi:hypothetical protein
VLIMVLLVLVICGTLLTATARRCGRGSLAAGAAQRELQVRWGTLSLRAALLPKAGDLMSTPQNLTALEIRRVVPLGGMIFNVILADEQAKVNINKLAETNKTAALEAVIRRLEADSKEMLRVQLRPTLGPSTPVYRSFDQVFDIRRPESLFGERQHDASVVRRRVTLWGNGRINLRRAEVPVMREALAGKLTETQMQVLHDLRGKKPDFGMEEAYSAMQLTRDQIAALEPLITQDSSCYSLWTSVDSKTRHWRRLYIQASASDKGDAEDWTFAW